MITFILGAFCALSCVAALVVWAACGVSGMQMEVRRNVYRHR